MSQENVKLVRRFHPGNGTDLVALASDDMAFGAITSAMEPFLTPDVTLETVFMGQRTTYTGLEGFRQAWLDWLEPWSIASELHQPRASLCVPVRIGNRLRCGFAGICIAMRLPLLSRGDWI